MKIHQELSKFFLVGFANTVFGYSIYSLFIFLGFNYFLAALISQIIGTLFNYKTIGTYVFPNVGNNKFFKFAVVYIATYLINITFLGLLISLGFNAYYSGAIILLPMALLTFYLNKYFVFNEQ